MTVGTDAMVVPQLVLTAESRVAPASYGGPSGGGVDLRLGLGLEEWFFSSGERLDSHTPAL
jgi:hypothetical protein